MKLTRYNPFSLTPSTFGRRNGFGDWLRSPMSGYDAMSSFFDLGDFFGAPVESQLATDLYEDENSFYARFEVPGVKKESVKVDLSSGLLTISVEKRESSEGSENSSRVTRSISVPSTIDAEKVAAKMEDGVLTVTLPKHEASKPRNITIG